MRDLHLGNHKRDQFIAERGIRATYTLAKEEKPVIEEPPPHYVRPPETPEEFEILHLDHKSDEGFLKTRGVKVTEAEATIKWRKENLDLTEDDKDFLKEQGIKHD